MKLLRDTWLIFQQQALLQSRRPLQTFVGALQPVMFLLLFAPLLKPALTTPLQLRHGVEVYSVFVPGILVLIALLGGLFHGFTLVGELRAGVIERSRVTPVSRSAVLLGHSLRAAAVVLLQSILITALAILLGLRVHVVDLLLAYLLLALISTMTSMISYGAALRLGNEEGLAQLMNLISQPAMLLSGILLPLSLAPSWLQSLAVFNPFWWAVEGSRAVFMGHAQSAVVWEGFLLNGTLTVLALLWAVRAYSHSIR